MSTVASFFRNLSSSQHSICSAMEQKKTALSALLRNMDTWQRQWEEGCPRGLNTTLICLLKLELCLVFFHCLHRAPSPNPRAEAEIGLIGFSHFCVTLLTVLNVKIRFWGFVAVESRVLEKNPLLSSVKSLLLNLSQMFCSPRLSSILSHPLHRLTGIQQRGWISLFDFMTFSQTGVSQNSEGRKMDWRMPLEEIAFF